MTDTGLPDDIKKVIHEFEHNKYRVKIVERKNRFDNNPFLYFYVLDNFRVCGGMNYAGFGSVSKEDLLDLSVCVPKIKAGIDECISDSIRWAQEKEEKRKELQWTGESFKRGDYVLFKGNDKYKPLVSYVWTHFGHLSMEFYIIEHEDGEDRERWLTSGQFPDGFECVHSSQLQEGLKYIQINCHEYFQGETDELEMILSKKDSLIKE